MVAKNLTRLLWLFSLLMLINSSALAVTHKEYDALIEQARTGNYEPALIMLRQQMRDRPDDLKAMYDHIIIAGWAGNADEVTRVYETLKLSGSPLSPVAQEAVARAYRDLKQWDQSLDLYHDGRMRYPKQTPFVLGEIMVLAETGRVDQAIDLGNSAVKSAPNEPDRRLALSYVYRIKHEPYAALHEADRAHALAPKKDYITREYIDALQQAGLGEAALRIAQQNPSLISTSQMRSLQADYAAELSRLASMPSRSEEERFAIADRALALYDKLIPLWQAQGDSARADVLRARFDRIQALHARSRMQEVINDYNTLRMEGVPVPRYILNFVASAYLYLKQPEKARDLYQEVTTDPADKQDDPIQRFDNKAGLTYALLESQDFNAANQAIDETLASQPTWLFVKGSTTQIPNNLHVAAEQTAALERLYANDTTTALQRLSNLAAQAPHNSGLRASLAQVYRRNQRPRQAEKELKMAETLAPTNLEVVVEQGYTAMDLQEWRQAQLLSANATQRFPENTSTRQLAQQWKTHNKAELQVSGYRGKPSQSDNPVSGSGDFAIETVLYSAPINYNWRVFGGVGYANGSFEEGSLNYRWLRTGAQWRSRDLTLEVEGSAHDYGFGTKPGGRISATYDLNDQWQTGASLQLRSTATPLRALINNISSNSASAFIRWKGGEQREWTLSLTPSRFSDGNNRINAELSGRERLYTSPRVQVDLQLSAAASHNSLQDTPYFNPRNDVEVLPTLNLTHVLYRRYDTSLEQNFIAGAGIYKQQGFGTGAITALGYGLRYRFNNVVDAGVTITGVSRPYDGQREREIRVIFDMNLRF